MHRIGSRRPSPATVISLVALFLALSGTGYAVAKLPQNSVGSAQVINGSLQKGDLSKKARAALKGNRGLRGAAGLAGPAGPAGPTGAAGAPGAAGAAGAAGATGAIGLPGPTFGDAGLDTGCCASSTPTGAAAATGSKTVTLPFAARLFVFASVRALIQTCTTNCNVQYGLRVDGVAVSGSLRTLSTIPGATTPTPNVGGLLTPWGITGTLGAGAHTIELVKEPTVGTMVSNGFGEQQIGAVALGS